MQERGVQYIVQAVQRTRTFFDHEVTAGAVARERLNIVRRMSMPGRLQIMLGLVVFAVSAFIAAVARAEPPPIGVPAEIWINPGIYSMHFDRDKNLRNNNVGLGVEAQFSGDHGAMAGTFINSNRARSHYAAYLWRPLHWEFSDVHMSAGIAVGAFDGYPNYRNGAWFAAAMPLFAIEGRYVGANLSVVPTYANRLDGAFAVQLKFRIW